MAIALVGLLSQTGWAGQHFSVYSDDGSSRLAISLIAQMRWDYRYLDGDDGNSARTENMLRFRRLRPVLTGRLLDGELSFKLHVNLVPGALELLDLWAEYGWLPTVRIRLGQAKIPFTRHRLNSFTTQTLVDWSGPTRYFGAERQVGITIHNGLVKPGRLEYQLGFYTGVNARASNGIGPALVYGETTGSSSSLCNPADSLLADMHSEIVGHLAFNSSGMDPSQPRDTQGGPPRFSVGLSLAWDLAPRPGEDLRLRLAPEAQLRMWGLALDAAFYLGLADLVVGSSNYRPALYGGLLELSWQIGESFTLASRYSLVATTSEVRGDAAERDDLLGREAVDRIGKDQEILVGFAWQLWGQTLVWQVDLGVWWREREQREDYSMFARTQLQLWL